MKDFQVGEYNESRMRMLVEKDAYLKFMLKDLGKRGFDEEVALQVLYNSEVLDGGTQCNKHMKRDSVTMEKVFSMRKSIWCGR